MPVQSRQPHLSIFEVHIDEVINHELTHDLIQITIENNLHLPDLCVLTIEDGKLRWIESETFKIGSKIAVKAGNEKDPSLTYVFRGEVTGIEMDMTAMGAPVLLVNCFDQRHRLQRGRKIRTFQNVSDSDIVKQVAASCGLIADAAGSPNVHDWVLQNNQSDWEFLLERAARVGFRLYLTGEKTLNFKPITSLEPPKVTLQWGNDLRSFRPRISATPQVNKTQVNGWDPLKKTQLVGVAYAPNGMPKVGISTNGGAVANVAFGDATMYVVDLPVETQAEAERVAVSVHDDIAHSYLQAEGLCIGAPQIHAGIVVKIKNVGSKFSGDYYVTSATHTYSPKEGYSTGFTVTGKSPASLLATVRENLARHHPPMGDNIVIGLVTNNQDPKNLGRVRVKYPCLGEKIESFWVRQAAPMAGLERGFYYLPEINDEVLVAFEHGDVSRPYILGSLWNGVDNPVETNDTAVGSDGEVNHRIIRTRIGHTFLFDDLNGKGEIKLTTKSGHYITLNDKDEHLTIQTKNRHHVILDDAGSKIDIKTASGHNVLLDDKNNKIHIVDLTGENSMTINSGASAIDIVCAGNITLDAKGKVSIKGFAGIELTTPAQIKAEGTAGVDVKSTAEINLEATGPATLKSSAIVVIQGSLVKIN